MVEKWEVDGKSFRLDLRFSVEEGNIPRGNVHQMDVQFLEGAEGSLRKMRLDRRIVAFDLVFGYVYSTVDSEAEPLDNPEVILCGKRFSIFKRDVIHEF